MARQDASEVAETEPRTAASSERGPQAIIPVEEPAPDSDSPPKPTPTRRPFVALPANPAKTEPIPPEPSMDPTPGESGGPRPAIAAPPPPGNPWLVPFGSRPSSRAITLQNCRDVVIENKTFRDLGAGVIAIRIVNCANVTIRAVDFINVAEGVFAVNSSNITVRDSRYSNITGPHERVGLNRGNLVQFAKVTGGLVDHNKGKGGDTEDIVSIYQSHNVIVEDNHFEGTAAATSTTGCGIGLSDEGGANNIARRNILLNPGACGIFIAGGTNNQILDNIIYGDARPVANVGIYVWNQSSAGCSGNTVSGNQVHWLNASGVSTAFWDGKNCGVTPSDNDWSAPLDADSLRVGL